MDAWVENRDKHHQDATRNHHCAVGLANMDNEDNNKRKKKRRLINILGPICTIDEDDRSFAERFRDFGNSTTFHGIRYVTDDRHNTLRRLLWLLIVLAMSAWLVFNIIQALHAYCRRPTTTSVAINYVDNITFPAVTLCNFNQFRRSLLPPEALKVLNQMFSPDPPKSIDFGPLQEFSGDQDLTNLVTYVSHNLETMLLQCKWKTTQECTSRNFTRRFTDHGICFTFNEPEDVAQRLQVRSAGSRHGLFLRLFTETDEYTLGENTALGFRILLHPQGMTPLVKELGFSVSPGFESSIAVRQTIIKSLPLPFESNCTDSDVEYSTVYSVATCRFECMVRYVVDKCGCRDYRYPGPAPICSPENHYNCIYMYEVEFQQKERQSDCSCPVSCEAKTYDKGISLGYWPAGLVTHRVPGKPGLPLTQEFVRKNILDVYIFFEELMYQEIKQVEAYGIAALQSDIGGYLGLLCGMSMITLMEWTDFILLSVLKKCRSKQV